MTQAGSDIEISIVNELADVDREQWNAVANPSSELYDPFLDWDFLEALERSHSATPETGWAPHHILAKSSDGKLTGAMPLYLKSHSQGEFVFDHAWADAYERAGGRYYPKLLTAIPFTPVTGRRRLVDTEAPNATAIADALLHTAIRLCADNNISSLHINFTDALEWERLGGQGLLQRQDQQFHWTNDDYETFDDFLAALASRKRKNLRKEREKAQESVWFLHLTGNALTPVHWNVFFDFYMDTGSRKWGTPYLTREFFELIHERMADKILLVMAYDNHTNAPIAGAMNMIGGDTLYGRYWGRREERPFLHFETCYYQAIDFAIKHKLRFVEAGAQGGHKLARGYTPTSTFSAHWIANEGFSDAVANYLEHERNEVDAHINYLGERTPFKRGD